MCFGPMRRCGPKCSNPKRWLARWITFYALWCKTWRTTADFLIDTLLKHASVRDCETSFVLDRVKSITVLPV